MDEIKTASPKPHFTEIDLCRGIGILLVVLGHAMKQTGETNTVFDILLSVIYSFHMPLFFILSGFVSSKILSLQTLKEKGIYIKSRAIRLLIPYFVVGLLYTPLKFYLSRYAIKPYNFSEMWRLLIGDNPDVSLWFLYTLFLCCTVSALILNRKTFPYVLGFSFVLAVVAYLFSWDFKFTFEWFYFLLGIVLREYYQTVSTAMKKRSFQFGALALFVLSNIVLFYGFTIITLITSVCGSFLCLSLALRLSVSQSPISRFFRTCGNYSMDIYILSEPINTVVRLILWNILHIHYVITSLVCFLIGLLLPLPITRYILRKVKLLRLLFLGISK